MFVLKESLMAALESIMPKDAALSNISYAYTGGCGCTGNCGQSCSGGCEAGCTGNCGRSCSGSGS